MSFPPEQSEEREASLFFVKERKPGFQTGLRLSGMTENAIPNSPHAEEPRERRLEARTSLMQRRAKSRDMSIMRASRRRKKRLLSMRGIGEG
jgi:hypothetical protein